MFIRLKELMAIELQPQILKTIKPIRKENEVLFLWDPYHWSMIYFLYLCFTSEPQTKFVVARGFLVVDTNEIIDY